MNSTKKSEKTQLDLFRLHSKNDGIMGWIWVRIRTGFLRKKLNNHITKVSWNIFCKNTSRELDCGFSTIGKYIIRIKYSQNETKIPLCFLEQLSKQLHIEKARIFEEILNFELNSDNTNTRVNVVNYITPSLCTLAGAFAADGYLQKEKKGGTYRLKIVEGEATCVRMIAKIVEQSFGIKPKVYYDKNQNCWYCWFNSKIIARYFIHFFKFKSGKKSTSVCIPSLIKSDQELRSRSADI